MPDLVVTVPRDLWSEWIAEGDAVGEAESGEEWGFFLGWQRPPIQPGERLYVVAHDRLRGYAPVTRVAFYADPCERHRGELTKMAVDALDDSLPLEYRQRCWDQVVASRNSKAPGCLWCQAEHGSVTRPRVDGRLVPGRWAVGRRGGAVAVTIPPRYSNPTKVGETEMAYIRGFQGFRQRWWPREAEFPFPDWATRDLWLNRAAGRRRAEEAKAQRQRERDDRQRQREADAKRQRSLFDG